MARSPWRGAVGAIRTSIAGGTANDEIGSASPRASRTHAAARTILIIMPQGIAAPGAGPHHAVRAPNAGRAAHRDGAGQSMASTLPTWGRSVPCADGAGALARRRP